MGFENVVIMRITSSEYDCHFIQLKIVVNSLFFLQKQLLKRNETHLIVHLVRETNNKNLTFMENIVLRNYKKK